MTKKTIVEALMYLLKMDNYYLSRKPTRKAKTKPMPLFEKPAIMKGNGGFHND